MDENDLIGSSARLPCILQYTIQIKGKERKRKYINRSGRSKIVIEKKNGKFGEGEGKRHNEEEGEEKKVEIN